MYISTIVKAYNEICNEEYHGELSTTSGRFVVVLALQVTKLVHCILSAYNFFTERTFLITFAVDVFVEWVFRFTKSGLMLLALYVLIVIISYLAAYRTNVTKVPVDSYLNRKQVDAEQGAQGDLQHGHDERCPYGSFSRR